MLHRSISLFLIVAFGILACFASPMPRRGRGHNPATPTTSATPSPTSSTSPSNSSSGGNGGSHTGRGTWYYPGLDACGDVDAEDSSVIALSMDLFYSNNGGYCGQMVEISYNGNTAQAMIHDACESCGYYDIDMGPNVFQQLADLDVGEMQVTWSML